MSLFSKFHFRANQTGLSLSWSAKQKTYEPRHENPSFCICENKGTDQLRGNRAADQRLCFRYIDSTNPLLP